ncbi:MAG TPA: hypothetical protein VG095_07580 [Chthoniobacterales bacterium]|nr:hypothetical protein [Chthoniobacterales bacterium]
MNGRIAVVAGGADPGGVGRDHAQGEPGSTRPATTTPLISSIAEILRQGESLLLTLDSESYTRRLPLAFDSAIGGHYRHCLDHFKCLLDGIAAGEVNYDQRERDRRIEADRAFALAETRRLQNACAAIAPGALQLPINVRSTVSYGGVGSSLIASTVGREVMYGVAHAIHHYALIGVMCALLGIRLPDGFGVAPSTLQHRGEQRAAA